MIAVQRMQAYQQLTSGIAHDFNNRLAVILGTTEILLDSASDEDQREMLQAVLSSGRRAAALVERLVGTTGRKSDDQEHLDLGSLLTELEPDLVRLSPSGITLVVDVGTDPLPVEADSSDLRQAITNLVVNATEAIADRGSVSIRARLVPAADAHASAMVELVVADDGSGMDEATEARIFEPFFTTRVGGGRSRGLGLPAVQGVVLRSRGEIDVRTELDEGTTITVRLPLHEPAVAPAPVEAPAPATPIEPGRATVLLVDDEAAVREMTGRMLTSAGYQVVSAGDAAEAMSILVSGDTCIDLVLSDVVMPGRSGVDLAHDVTRWRPGLPVLLMSGFVGESAHAGIMADLPFPLLAKPTPRAALLEAVADLLPVPA
jgi:CheY-like chemotaxis protein/two-component sensor histidine kinase